MDYYCHSIPGRLRIKTPIIRRNPVQIEKVRNLLQSVPGVTVFDINALTGSIKINYDDCTTNPETILSILQQNGYYRGDRTESLDYPIEAAFSSVGTAVGKALLGALVGKAFENSTLSFLAMLV